VEEVNLKRREEGSGEEANQTNRRELMYLFNTLSQFVSCHGTSLFNAWIIYSRNINPWLRQR